MVWIVCVVNVLAPDSLYPQQNTGRVWIPQTHSPSLFTIQKKWTFCPVWTGFLLWKSMLQRPASMPSRISFSSCFNDSETPSSIWRIMVAGSFTFRSNTDFIKDSRTDQTHKKRPVRRARCSPRGRYDKTAFLFRLPNKNRRSQCPSGLK